MQTQPVPAPPPEDIMTKTFVEIKKILDRKMQIILYGPPGTGKTFTSNKYVEKEYPEQADRDKYVRRCTFHPEYGYEHFIEGYRPKTVEGQMVFERVDGVFKKLCDKAKANDKKDFYLIKRKDYALELIGEQSQ